MILISSCDHIIAATPFAGKNASVAMQEDDFTGFQYSQSSHMLPNGASYSNSN